jgi:SAM-dependent methyltransferase
MERAAYDEMRALEEGHWWFRARRARSAAFVRRAVAGGARRVLEIGCGTGGNLAHLAPRAPGARWYGIDADAGALALCAARGLGGLVRADGLKLPLRDSSLGALLAFDVIEHFVDDAALLAELHRVLAPGGALVASVPQHPWLWSPHDEFLHHKRRYARGELESKLAAAGFGVELARGFNFLLLPPIALVRALRRRARDRRAGPGAPGASGAPRGSGTDFFELPAPLNAAMAGVFGLEELLCRAFPIRSGVSLLVLARRTTDAPRRAAERAP